MKKWLKYIIIFGLIGAVIGFFLYPQIIHKTTRDYVVNEATGEIGESLEDNNDIAELSVIGSFLGLIIGIIIGLIVNKLKK